MGGWLCGGEEARQAGYAVLACFPCPVGPHGGGSVCVLGWTGEGNVMVYVCMRGVISVFVCVTAHARAWCVWCDIGVGHCGALVVMFATPRYLGGAASVLH